MSVLVYNRWTGTIRKVLKNTPLHQPVQIGVARICTRGLDWSCIVK